MKQNRLIGYLEHMQQAATKIMDYYPDFVEGYSIVPWRGMRGMRNRIAHGYFEINLDVVWETVQTALPKLLKLLSALRDNANDKS